MRSDVDTEIDSNEIDLGKVVRVIWVQKWLVVLVMFFVASLFSIYAFLAQPVYEAKFYLSPPTLDDVANLNYGRTGELKPFSVDDVYKIFLRNLQSQALRQSFYREVYLSDLKANNSRASMQSYEQFSSRISVAPLDKDPMGRWSLSILDSRPEIATNWVSLYATRAAQLAQREVVSDTTKEASVRARGLKLQIDSLRAAGKKLREDTIFRLTESLAVARATGIEKSVVLVGGGATELAGDMVDSSAFMRGTKALEAELNNLKSRESNDPFLPGLRQLQTNYDFYKSIELDDYKISVFRPDGTVEPPEGPIKPKRIMLILSGIVLGGLLGVLIAFVRGYRSYHFK